MDYAVVSYKKLNLNNWQGRNKGTTSTESVLEFADAPKTH